MAPYKGLQDSIMFWDSYIYPLKVDSMFLQLKGWKLQGFAYKANGKRQIQDENFSK